MGGIVSLAACFYSAELAESEQVVFQESGAPTSEDSNEVDSRERAIDPTQGFNDLNPDRMERARSQRIPVKVVGLSVVPCHSADRVDLSNCPNYFAPC